MSVFVALEVVSSQQAVLELRHVEHATVIHFGFIPCSVAEELQSSAAVDVSSWSASSTISYFTVAYMMTVVDT